MLGYDYEDKYILGNGSVSSTSTTEGNEVSICCKTKKVRISGYISEGIDLKGHAKWKEMFGGGIGALNKGLLQTGSNIAQLFNGTTLQQPWMNRKFYESTDPFSFTFGINFVSHGDGLKDVLYPATYLLSLTYPRYTGKSLVKSALNKAGLAPAPDSVIGTLIDAMTEMVIPGPAVTYRGGDDQDPSHGDAVTITIGQSFAFGGVYLEDVSISFSSSFDKDGYPLFAKCKVTATCMDVNYCDSDGSFLISRFKNGQFEAMNNFLDKVGDTGERLVKDFKVLIEDVSDFWGYFLGKKGNKR